MKRTTYIMAGVLLAGLVIMCGTIFYISKLGTSWEEVILEVGGNQKTVQLQPCKVVQLSMTKAEYKKMKEGYYEIDGMVAFTEVPLTVCSDSVASGSFSYAAEMEQFVSIQTVGDTLHIAFDFADDKLDEKYRNQNWLRVRSAAMTLALPAGVQRVVSDIESMETTFSNVHCDTLSFHVRNLAYLENCHIASLSVQAQSLRFNSGEVKDLYLDMDNVSDWRVNTATFKIDTEHLSGSDNHYCSLQKNECRQVLWTPLKEDATLNMKLNQAVKIEVGE